METENPTTSLATGSDTTPRQQGPKTDGELMREREEQVAAQKEQWEQDQRHSAWDDVLRDIGQRYAHATLKGFTLHGTDDEQKRQQDVVDQIRAYGKSLKERFDEGQNVIFFGPAGTGKDHLLTALMRQAILTFGLTVEWTDGMTVYRRFRDAMDSSTTERDVLRDFWRPQILAISDPLPPKGALTDYQAGTVFQIIDHRYRRSQPTWVTVNVKDGDEASQRMGEQVVDRLRDGALVLNCNWPSWRSRERG